MQSDVPWPGWRKWAAEGLKYVAEYHPEIAGKLAEVLRKAAPAKAGAARPRGPRSAGAG